MSDSELYTIIYNDPEIEIKRNDNLLPEIESRGVTKEEAQSRVLQYYEARVRVIKSQTIEEFMREYGFYY